MRSVCQLCLYSSPLSQTPFCVQLLMQSWSAILLGGSQTLAAFSLPADCLSQREAFLKRTALHSRRSRSSCSPATRESPVNMRSARHEDTLETTSTPDTDAHADHEDDSRRNDPQCSSAAFIVQPERRH